MIYESKDRFNELLYTPILYTDLLTSAINLSKAYYTVPYETWIKLLSERHRISDYIRWMEIMANRFDEVLGCREFTSALGDYLNSWLKIHSIFRNLYPLTIKSLDLLFEQYIFNLFNAYTHMLANIFHTKRELDTTPYDVIYEGRNVRLLHYKSKDGRYPLLIVYSMINRYHIMDISKEKSVVKRLLENGIDVYLIEWGNVGYDDNLSLSNYVHDIEQAIKKIKYITKKNKISILGYCWGGIPTLIYASLHKDDLNGLIMMAVPIDASKDDTTLARWTKNIDAKKMIAEYGHMHGQVLNIVFLMRNPIKYILLKYIQALQRIDDAVFLDTFIAVERWLYNTPIIPGKLYEEIVENIYKNNMLISGKFVLNEKIIDPSMIDIPLLSIVAENDDLTSPASTLALNDHVSSKDKHIISIPGGHVGLCISSIAHKKIWPEVARWIIEKSNIND